MIHDTPNIRVSNHNRRMLVDLGRGCGMVSNYLLYP
jgi:hypothetical protein